MWFVQRNNMACGLLKGVIGMWFVQSSNMTCGSLKGVTWHVVC